MRVPRWVLGAGLAATLAGSGLITAGLVSAASSTTSTATSSSTSGSTSTSSSSTGSTTTSNKVSTFINDLAKNLGISVSTLQTALKQTETQQVQNLQTAGKITSSTASKIEKRIQAGNGMPMFGMGPGFGRGFGPGGMAPGPVNVLQTAASYLGLTQAQLRTDMQSGKSLNAIANAQSGKSASGLQAALIAAAQTALGKQVTAGTITSAQEQTRLAGFEKNLTNILSRTGEMGHEGMWRGPHMRWRGEMRREDHGSGSTTGGSTTGSSTGGSTTGSTTGGSTTGSTTGSSTGS